MDGKSKSDCNGRLKLLFACSGAADAAENIEQVSVNLSALLEES